MAATTTIAADALSLPTLLITPPLHADALPNPPEWFDAAPILKFLDTLPPSSYLYDDATKPSPSAQRALLAYQLDGFGLREVEADWDDTNLAYDIAWKAVVRDAMAQANKERKSAQEARLRAIKASCLVFKPLALTPDVRATRSIAPGEEAWDVDEGCWVKLTAETRIGGRLKDAERYRGWMETWGVDVKRVRRMITWQDESNEGEGEWDAGIVGLGFWYWREKERGLEWWDEDEIEDVEVRGWDCGENSVEW
jgi:hypothetical protein